MRSQDARDQLNKLLANEEVKIVYDEPWFWKLSISRSTKPDCAPKPYQNSVHGRNSHGRKKTIEITEHPTEPIQEKVVDLKNDPIVARANSTKRTIRVKKGSLKVVATGFRQYDAVKIVDDSVPDATGPSYSGFNNLE
jgi:hypothetical protein